MEKIKPLNREDWVDADPANGISGAIPPAKAFSQTMEEMVNVILASGQEPSGEDLHQFEKGIKGLVKQEVDEANLLAVSNTVYQNHIGSFVFTHNKMRGTKATGSLNGCYECNGDEFSESDFEGDANPYKLLCNDVLSWVSYENYQNILERFGNCGYYGLDKENHKFKVPTITDAFLQAGTPGEFKEAGLPDHIHNVKVSSDGSKGGFDTAKGYLARGFTKYSSPWSNNNNNGVNKVLVAGASASNQIYGKSKTVQPPAVGCRIMVQLANEIDNATSIENYVTVLTGLKESGVSAINDAAQTADELIKKDIANLENIKSISVSAVNDAKDAAISDINTAKSSAVSELQDIKTAAVNAVSGYREEAEVIIDKAMEKAELLEELTDNAEVKIESLTVQNVKAEENITALTTLNNAAATTVETVVAKAAEAAASATAASEARTAAETMANGFDAHVQEKTTAAETAISEAQSQAITAVNTAAESVSAAVNAASEAASQATEIANSASQTANSVVEQLSGFTETVTTAKTEITELSGTEKTAITTLATTEKTAISTAAETAKTTAVGAVNTAKDAAVQDVETAGAAITGYQPAITGLTNTSGTVTLAINKVYTLSITGNTTFTLPTPSNKNVFNQIKVILKVTGTPTINWGTTKFFNNETPEIEAGCYDVYFDFDNNLNAWVVGAMPKGVAS